MRLLKKQTPTDIDILKMWDYERENACGNYDTYEEYLKAYPDETSYMFLPEHKWDELRPTFKVMKSKANNIIKIFKEWENDIKRTGEKLYR